MRPMRQNLMFLVPYTTLAPTFGQALKEPFWGHWTLIGLNFDEF